MCLRALKCLTKRCVACLELELITQKLFALAGAAKETERQREMEKERASGARVRASLATRARQLSQMVNKLIKNKITEATKQ